MKSLFVAFVAIGLVGLCRGQSAGSAQTHDSRDPHSEHGVPDGPRWASEAARVTIVRDDWGIAHVHGKTDADAVFGMIYAQCEDDFHRVEMNYLTALGRTAEAVGEKAIWADLRQRLFIDPEDLQKDYAESPEWLKKLMDAWADGINFYLATHQQVKPEVLTRFEPWMALKRRYAESLCLSVRLHIGRCKALCAFTHVNALSPRRIHALPNC